MPAYAQDTAPAQQEDVAPVPDQTGPTEEGEAIVVTGSILRNADEGPSPVTTVTAEALDQRGVSTIQEGLQQLVSNNGPAITNSFTANGAFAAGASAVSLRGLTTNSTLVLFDGLRAAYYPLADDGTRNFVDLNTIPDDIVERVEVLRDGASSSYGADAIAGVVNIITRREFEGVLARAQAGISSRGDAAEYRLSLTTGVGDLDTNGMNGYISGFYYRSESLANNQRPYPYNTDDERGICFEDVCGPNNVVNGLNGDGEFDSGVLTVTPAIVRPVDPVTGAPTGARYQQLQANCGNLPSYTLTAAERAANPSTPTTVCQEDFTSLYGNIQPEIERFGGSARFTAAIGETSEAYAQVNFLQTTSSYFGATGVVRGNAPAAVRPRFSTSTAGQPFAPGSGPLRLPVYVCPERVNCATSPNRTLNPNNPFAAAGQAAELRARFPVRQFDETVNRAYRAAIGVRGDISDNFSYNVDATAMHTDLRRTFEGYVYIQHLLDVIADGTYNWRDPSANSQDVIDYVIPTNIQNSTSDLYQVQGVVSGTVAQLPGGPLQLGVGASIRYEGLDNPSANPDDNGPTQRYFEINSFGAVGNRTVRSVFAELNAPIIDSLDINLSGRYDSYSSGQDAFSPKIGARFEPFSWVALRGTYSQGFRIPSFGEANSFPTTGFVNASSGIYTDSYLAPYGCSRATFSTCPSYIRGSYGLTSLATPDLKPEKSRSFTLGLVVEPIRNVTLTVDYYNIRKTDAIVSADTSEAIAAYYAGQPIPAGFNVIADAPDPNNPTLRPRIAFVESGYINAARIDSEGLDLGVTTTFDITDNIRWTSAAQATYIINLSQTQNDQTLSFEGTLGNYNLTAGSGTPEWRGSWQNTFDFGDFALTGTANYFDGYNLSAEDQFGPGTSGQCGFDPGFVPCDVDSYITFDLVGNWRINDNYDLYLTMLNVLDEMPPVDPVTYGAARYNPVQGGLGILGRYFKVGVKANF
ncbi:TonB-dependent receptor [Allosphingosinicella flava]|uniref:TonB-dependent receptor n=1 Tax=Allosphingosinicella flava TaxID=2771430 RepID=A0A7T2GIZ5_9SPHN|nr:TonB-dependent receptor [Sphingosinicella flava]QPQ54711.1 TonB-dependent receptor [Sphingosinicella flava]